MNGLIISLIVLVIVAAIFVGTLIIKTHEPPVIVQEKPKLNDNERYLIAALVSTEMSLILHARNDVVRVYACQTLTGASATVDLPIEHRTQFLDGMQRAFHRNGWGALRPNPQTVEGFPPSTNPQLGQRVDYAA